jgi:SNF2 family DNA or RNA helicase
MEDTEQHMFQWIETRCKELYVGNKCGMAKLWLLRLFCMHWFTFARGMIDFFITNSTTDASQNLSLYVELFNWGIVDEETLFQLNTKEALLNWMTKQTEPLPLISDVDIGNEECGGKNSQIQAFDTNVASWKSVEMGSKFLVIEKILKHLEGLNRKCLVFCEFLSPLILLNAALKNKFPTRGIFFYHGKLDTLERANQLKAFQLSKDSAILLSTVKSGGVGLNIIEASAIIFLHEDWNPQVTQQAIGRAVRVGLYYNFFLIYC